MSKQLSSAAILSVIATAIVALAMLTTDPVSDGAARGPTAHGSLIEILIRA